MKLHKCKGCFGCVSREVIQDIQENYILNREQIITKLYTFLNRYDVTHEKFETESETEKYTQCLEKLNNIQQMIENGEDENDVLIELEILEVSAQFLQRDVIREQNRILGRD